MFSKNKTNALLSCPQTSDTEKLCQQTQHQNHAHTQAKLVSIDYRYMYILQVYGCGGGIMFALLLLISRMTTKGRKGDGSFNLVKKRLQGEC